MSDAAIGRDLAGQRVLVVEDEFFIADDLAHALHGLGAEVIGPVPGKQDALNLIATNGRIDFAVLDLNLHGDTSYAVGDALAERGVPFVLATGYAREILPSRFRDRPYWEKPFDPRMLAHALRDIPRAS
jgi:CheY-like chemotaxis protein